MRKTVKLSILLLVAAVMYFGYSAWIDSVALFSINGFLEGSTEWKAAVDTFSNLPGTFEPNYWSELQKALDLYNSTAATDKQLILSGIMSSSSLMYKILSPFKLLLFGGVIGLFVPLAKQLFASTLIGMKQYISARQTNVLFNYQKTIDYAKDLHSKLLANDFEGTKGLYASYSGLAFKPRFLTNMLEEIALKLINFQDVDVFSTGSEKVVAALEEMYEKERRRSLNGRGEEMFFDFKRGYEYCANGSKYIIAYYSNLKTNDKTKIEWKLFSLEITKFNISLIVAFIPAILLSSAIAGILGQVLPAGYALYIGLTFLWVVFAIILHALLVFKNKENRTNIKKLIKPALTFYSLYFVMFITIGFGAVSLMAVGDIRSPGTAGLIWVWFSALAYLVLSACLIWYVISTLVDAFRSPDGLTKALIIDGIILPLVAWLLVTGTNIAMMVLNNMYPISATTNPDWVAKVRSILSYANLGILIVFWIYLFISNFLIANIVSKKSAMQLLESGIQADKKFKEKQSKSKA
ncbi:hypothetical protein ESOMN_v1c01740 [Williamsoniiplasma somnilux]|uniref:Uncharacterized protein n=1 Tax=Williamsoniiplasma somnilux TaxID=215578 RepID=A0A2K8NXL3_9MOLU|nr:hypothetical protein [Williamsoniiplasma somnilux]ATZ18559.1 hypothetical protein ESOMN_v1c01740 [Williamsoniiplasma somnilux]